MTTNNLIITPKTKIFDLLVSFPQLEQKLFDLSPSLKKINNPQMLQTVTKIMTVNQVAEMAGLRIEDLVVKLRKEVGQEIALENNETGNSINFSKPDWYSDEKIVQTMDVRPILAAGDHPVHLVLAELKGLIEGQIFKMTAPFLPSPLIDKASSLNFRHWIEKISESEYNIYFYK